MRRVHRDSLGCVAQQRMDTDCRFRSRTRVHTRCACCLSRCLRIANTPAANFNVTLHTCDVGPCRLAQHPRPTYRVARARAPVSIDSNALAARLLFCTHSRLLTQCHRGQIFTTACEMHAPLLVGPFRHQSCTCHRHSRRRGPAQRTRPPRDRTSRSRTARRFWAFVDCGDAVAQGGWPSLLLCST